MNGSELRRRAANAIRDGYLGPQREDGRTFDQVSFTLQRKWLAAADAVIQQLDGEGLLADPHQHCPDAMRRIAELWDGNYHDQRRRERMTTTWPDMAEAIDELVNCGDTSEVDKLKEQLKAAKQELELERRSRKWQAERCDIMASNRATLEKRVAELTEERDEYKRQIDQAVSPADEKRSKQLWEDNDRLRLKNQLLSDRLNAARNDLSAVRGSRNGYQADLGKAREEITRLRNYANELEKLNKHLQDEREKWKWEDFVSSSELEKLRRQVGEVTNDMACGVAACGCAPKELKPYYLRLEKILNTPGNPVYEEAHGGEGHDHRVGSSVSKPELGD